MDTRSASPNIETVVRGDGDLRTAADFVARMSVSPSGEAEDEVLDVEPSHTQVVAERELARQYDAQVKADAALADGARDVLVQDEVGSFMDIDEFRMRLTQQRVAAASQKQRPTGAADAHITQGLLGVNIADRLGDSVQTNADRRLGQLKRREAPRTVTGNAIITSSSRPVPTMHEPDLSRRNRVEPRISTVNVGATEPRVEVPAMRGGDARKHQAVQFGARAPQTTRMQVPLLHLPAPPKLRSITGTEATPAKALANRGAAHVTANTHIRDAAPLQPLGIGANLTARDVSAASNFVRRGPWPRPPPPPLQIYSVPLFRSVGVSHPDNIRDRVQTNGGTTIARTEVKSHVPQSASLAQHRRSYIEAPSLKPQTQTHTADRVQLRLHSDTHPPVPRRVVLKSSSAPQVTPLTPYAMDNELRQGPAAPTRTSGIARATPLELASSTRSNNVSVVPARATPTEAAVREQQVSQALARRAMVFGINTQPTAGDRAVEVAPSIVLGDTCAPTRLPQRLQRTQRVPATPSLLRTVIAVANRSARASPIMGRSHSPSADTW